LTFNKIFFSKKKKSVKQKEKRKLKKRLKKKGGEGGGWTGPLPEDGGLATSEGGFEGG